MPLINGQKGDDNGQNGGDTGSDNGGVHRVSQLAPLRSCKGSLFEGGIRVPTCMRWTGTVKPGTTCGTPVVSGNTATCTVTLSNDDVEDFDVSAVANVTFSEGAYSDTVTRSTDGTTTPAGNSNSGPATKYFVDAAISIADDGVNEVGESHDFTVAIPNEAFLSGRVRYQDAPDICFLKIQRELSEGGEGSVPARTLRMTDQELEEYKLSHTPKSPRRRS